MVTLAIVEHLDVVEGGVGQLDARLPLPSVEQLVLHARPERLRHRVIERVTNRPERRHETRVADPLGEGPGAELTRFNRRKQHLLVEVLVDVRRRPLLVSSRLGSCEVACCERERRPRDLALTSK